MKLLLASILILGSQLLSTQSMGLALEGDEWATVNAYPVKGRTGNLIKQTITFDGYKTLDIDRSWTKGSEVTTGLTQGVPTDEFYTKLITTDVIHKKQTIYFAMADQAGNQSQAFCATHLDARDFNIGNSDVSVFNLLLDIAGPGVKSSNVFYSRVYVGESAIGWDLFIDNEAAAAKPKKYVGYLMKSQDEYYTLTPVTRVKSKKGKIGSMPFGSSGFEIRNKAGQPLAAVSMIDKGIIYLMDMGAEERLLMATACTSLLLQEAAL